MWSSVTTGPDGELVFDGPISDVVRAGAAMVRSLSDHERALRAEDAPAPRGLAVARVAALVAATASLAAAGAECRRATPFGTIEAVTDANGDMIYVCTHTPAHRWRLDGSKI
jgi:hypothetical protein